MQGTDRRAPESTAQGPPRASQRGRGAEAHDHLGRRHWVCHLPSANAPAFHIVFRCDLDRVPIESMMLVKARVFRGDDRVLEIGRDLDQRDEFVPFVIRRVVNPRLQAAFQVHRGGRWVDPPGSHEEQRSKRPKKRHSDEKASNEGSERDFPMRSLGGCVWIFSHTSE